MAVDVPTDLNSSGFEFEISLTVLNHLGRQLYRNFITIIGEAISNSWDADANNVFVTLDHETDSMLVVDDGVGMTPDQLQNRFLKVGYSKRRQLGTSVSPEGRPFIGAKGIGKLALLSCADKVSVVTKALDSDACGCLIDNRELDLAIKDDLTPDQLTLPQPSSSASDALGGKASGTALFFENVRVGNSTDEFLMKALALSFRFSLVDPAFTIHYNGQEVTEANLADLARTTQYMWATPGFKDPYLRLTSPKREASLPMSPGVRGFIGSVEKPRQLEIYGTGTRVGIDLFVNGRLRESNLLQRLPTSRVPAQYLYGQLHLDRLDVGAEDPFTSSREGVVEGNATYDSFVEELRSQLNVILDEWDKFRIEGREPGDGENKRLRPVERAARDLSTEAIREILPKPTTQAQSEFAAELHDAAQASAQDYMSIYVVENALRDALRSTNAAIPSKLRSRAAEYRQSTARLLLRANLDIPVRTISDDLSYLGIDDLIQVADRATDTNLFAGSDDSIGVKVLRNSVMHTVPLTEQGKRRLAAIRDNMQAKTKKMVDILRKKAKTAESDLR